MKIALIYHGVLRWPGGILTQLNQLKDHNIDLFFCLQNHCDGLELLKNFSHKRIDLYQRPDLNFFKSKLDFEFLLSLPNQNWFSYSPYLKRSFSLLNYHNFSRIKDAFGDLLHNYDIVIISRSDLLAVFPFDFSDFNDKKIFVSDGFAFEGVQLIGNWFYGSPEIICKTLPIFFSTLKDEKCLKKWAPEIANVEGYAKFCLQTHNIPYHLYPLNCFISAGNFSSERTGWGKNLHLNPKTGEIFKYGPQYEHCMNNYQKYKNSCDKK